MDLDDAMLQQPKGKFRPEVLLLAGAALILGTMVGIRLVGTGPENSPPVAATMPAGSIDQLEALAKANPTDSLTLQALGQAYFDQDNYVQAAAAYRKASAAAPDRAVLWSSLGEAVVMASVSDPMPAGALANFRHALELDPKDPRARYFVAVNQDLGGDHKGAIAAWLALLADTPKGAPWEADLKRTIEQVGKINKLEVASRMAAINQPAPVPSSNLASDVAGPSAEDLRNAAAVPPSEQRRMAEGMVAGLEAKLRANPRNIDGWIMLMRSRMTLGQPEQASAALKAAIAANPGAEMQLRQQAKGLGIG